MEALLIVPSAVVAVELIALPLGYLRHRRDLRRAAARRGRRVTVDDVLVVLAPTTQASITFALALAAGVLLGRLL